MSKPANEKILRAGPSQKAGESRSAKAFCSTYTEGATFARTTTRGSSEGRKKGETEEAGRLAGAVSTLTSDSDGSMETVASSTRSRTGKIGRSATRSPASSCGLQSPRRGFLSARESEVESEVEGSPHRVDPSEEEMPAAGPSSRADRMARRKRSVSEEVARHGGDDESRSSPAKVATSKRGRGRQPNTGQRADTAKAEEELTSEARRGEKRLEQCSRLPNLESEQMEGTPWTAIESRITEAMRVLFTFVAQTVRVEEPIIIELEEALKTFREAFAVAKERDVSAEVVRLRKANKAQQIKFEELSREMTSQLAKARAQARIQAEALAQGRAQAAIDAEEAEKRIAERVGAIVNARIEGLEVSGRLLPEKSFRPSLEADRRREAAAATKPAAEEISSLPCVPVEAQVGSAEVMEWQVVKKGRKGKGKKVPAPTSATAAKPAPKPRAPAAPTPRPQAPQERQWSEVVKRGPTKKATPSPTKKAAKLRPPRTAAVVLTLRPAAEERGLTYYKAVSEAVNKINLADLGVPPIRMREAATGARVIEIPGEERGEKADVLASKLREVFAGEDGVVVSRPEITIDLRVTGLDDSIDHTRLTAALASAGGCPTSAVCAGVIKKGPAGMGTAFVRCPVTAAKKIVAAGGGRLLVGWSAAQVRILSRRPRRCFRCLKLGHVRAQCESEVDRSDECYRCGQNGHKAVACSAAPHCSLCAAIGKSADHLSGGKACARPPAKMRTRGRRSRRDPSPMVGP